MAHILGGYWMDPFPQDYYQSQENWKTNVTEGGEDFPTVVVSLNRFRLLSLSDTHTNEGTNDSIWNGVDGFRFCSRWKKSRPLLRSTQRGATLLQKIKKKCADVYKKDIAVVDVYASFRLFFPSIHSGPEGRNIPDKIRHRVVFFFF